MVKVLVQVSQYKAINNLKNEMPPNAMLLHVDYAESYENKQQDECKSAYFGHTTFSLFTAAVYIRHEESLINENFVIVSEAIQVKVCFCTHFSISQQF